MIFVLLALWSAIFSCQLTAEEEAPSKMPIQRFESGEISASSSFYTEDWNPEQELPFESSLIFFGEIELTAPPSFYTDSWDPKEKFPLKLSGIRVEEKDLVVDLDKAIKESRKEQDLLRSQSSWLSEPNPWVPLIESKEEFYEEIEASETQE